MVVGVRAEGSRLPLDLYLYGGLNQDAVVLLDQAGWHGSEELEVPDNITLFPLPPRSPERNPVENVWQFIRDNWLSNWFCFRLVESCLLTPGLPSRTGPGSGIVLS